MQHITDTSRTKKTPRRGYTLFEVMLSLSLLLVITMLIGAIINTHLNNVNVSRMQVEEAHLARTLLNRIAADIRAVVLDPETTTTSSTSPTDSSDSESETDSTTSDDSTEYSDTYDYENELIGTKRGIYGGTDWLQIDTRRVVSGERFAYQTDNYSNLDETEEVPTLYHPNSGERTVLYYLGSDTQTVDADEEYLRKQEGASVAPELKEQGTILQSTLKYGLYYREMNRTMTQYAIESGADAATNLSDNDEHLAPEIDKVEFYYFAQTEDSTSSSGTSTLTDGDWLDEWDMDAEEGKLPLAVQIVLSIRRKDYKPSLVRSLLTSDEGKRVVTYSLIVPLSRELIDLSETTDTSGDSTTDSSSTSGTNGGIGGNGGV